MSAEKEPSDLENTMEDALGFNFRSLRTLRDILIRLNKVFQTYASGDRVTYTPALRLWLGMLSLTFLLFLFAGSYTDLLKQALQQNESALDALKGLAGEDIDPFLDKMASSITLLQAPIVGMFTALSIFILKPFNPQLGFVPRLNIAFATLSAGTLLGAITAVLTVTGLMPITNWQTFAIWVVYFVTFWRGAPNVVSETRMGAFTKALIFSLAVIALVIFANLVNMIIAMVYATISIGPGT